MINILKRIIVNLFFNPKINIPLMFDLTGKTVVITGASRGIGKHVAEILYQENANLILVSRNNNDLENAYSGFDKKRLLLVKGDVTSESDCNNIVHKAVLKFGGVNILINNAGIIQSKSLEAYTIKEWEASMNTNINGIFLMCKAVIPVMKKQKNGLILNMGSKVSRNSSVRPNLVVYATTKYAVEGFSYSLGKEIKKYGIRVVCLMPGTVNTVMSTHVRKYLSPYRIGQVISMVIKFEDIDFENIIVKSKHQNI